MQCDNNNNYARAASQPPVDSGAPGEKTSKEQEADRPGTPQDKKMLQIGVNLTFVPGAASDEEGNTPPSSQNPKPLNMVPDAVPKGLDSKPPGSFSVDNKKWEH